MKNFKSKISTLFTIMLIILSTLGICNVLAEEAQEAKEKFGEVIIESNHTHTYSNGSYIPYSNLNDYYDVTLIIKLKLQYGMVKRKKIHKEYLSHI